MKKIVECTKQHRLCEHRKTWCYAESAFMTGKTYCSRPSGHTGNHVACGLTAHNIAVWANNSKAVKPRKKITVLADTKVKDLKVGDLVMTGEIMRIVKIVPQRKRYHQEGGTWLCCVIVKPRCSICRGKPCIHEFIKTIGCGQQCIQKVEGDTHSD